MNAEIANFFKFQRQIFGICPVCQNFFRLSDCKIYSKKKPLVDWMDKVDMEKGRLVQLQEKLEDEEEAIRKIEREKGRLEAQRIIKRIDPIFAPRELAAIEPKDINKEARAITINHPVKGHRPRIITVSLGLINRLETVMKEQGRTFNAEQLRRAFLLKKKAAARKLSNPRLKEVTFITFRHWVGTMEYHRTKDILHV